MESRHLLIEGVLIIRHTGRLNGAGLMSHLGGLFTARVFDQAKYVVSDFSEIAEVACDDCHGREIGALVRDWRNVRARLRRPFRWAVVTADKRVERLTGIIAVGAGDGVFPRVFTGVHEALLWAQNPKILMEIACPAAWKNISG
ncbi:MAG: hypothetical protein ACOZHQ_01320 [Thermodesulfobacteriota bacterium]